MTDHSERDEAAIKIIDFTAGNRAIWFDKQNPWTVWLDKRVECSPTIVCDSKMTMFPKEYFDLCVFDPPHVNFGKNAKLTKNYGHHTTKEIKELISGVAKEAHRVVRTNGLMAFKWNDHDIKLEKAIGLLEPFWIPLFGQRTSVRTARASTTYWVQLVRNNGASRE